MRCINNLISGFLALSFFFFAFSFFFTAHAAPDFDITKVRGSVTGPDGNPWVLANIVVTCDGHTQNTISGGQGKFIVVFFGEDTCSEGDIATVTATKDGVSGSGSGPVQVQRDGRFVDINFSVINISVPEFGLVTAAVALLGSGFYLLHFRKRLL